jgi:hypothetical protein
MLPNDLYTQTIKKGYEMIKRITISVQDDLYSKLGECKAAMNISKICQGAIMRSIQEHDMKRMEPQEKAVLIDLLRR